MSSTLEIVRAGVETVPPEYLLLLVIDRVVGTLLTTFCHVMVVSLGSAVTTQLITTDSPTLTVGLMLANTDGTSEKFKQNICFYQVRNMTVVFLTLECLSF